MGMLGVALVLAFEDAQEMFQRNVLCVYVRVGVDQIPRVFMLSAAFAPCRDNKRGFALPTRKLTIAGILDVPCCGSVL